LLLHLLNGSLRLIKLVLGKSFNISSAFIFPVIDVIIDVFSSTFSAHIFNIFALIGDFTMLGKRKRQIQVMASDFIIRLRRNRSRKGDANQQTTTQYFESRSFNCGLFLIIKIDAKRSSTPAFSGKCHPESNNGSRPFLIKHDIFFASLILLDSDKLAAIPVGKPRRVSGLRSITIVTAVLTGGVIRFGK